MTEGFWLEHVCRCKDCGRKAPLADARADGWRVLGEPDPDHKHPQIISGICWRCYREQRANS